ncbi:MAG: SDR family oxidoreductase [Cyclobacteriaceae bacterium]|nr:SDR family oxidoreductase [Cyclobacteriaceae bacterium]
MAKSTVLILGASSDVGKSLAEYYYSKGYGLVLAARNTSLVEAYLSKWPDRNEVKLLSFDANEFSQHKEWFTNMGIVPDITICVFGYLGDQEKASRNWDECNRILISNYSGAVSILNVVAEVYRVKKKGVIAGISSVAGDRGRQSNYFYGSAKAGFTAYLSGLRNSLLSSGVHVLTVKPGFINTKMTAGLNLPKPLTAQPEQVAKAVYLGCKNRRNTIYVLPIWRLIMLVIKWIPEFIFKRLKL